MKQCAIRAPLIGLRAVRASVATRGSCEAAKTTNTKTFPTSRPASRRANVSRSRSTPTQKPEREVGTRGKKTKKKRETLFLIICLEMYISSRSRRFHRSPASGCLFDKSRPVTHRALEAPAEGLFSRSISRTDRRAAFKVGPVRRRGRTNRDMRRCSRSCCAPATRYETAILFHETRSPFGMVITPFFGPHSARTAQKSVIF